MAEKIKATWLRKDVTGHVSATTQRVGGDILHLQTPGASWEVRIDCNQTPATCPVIAKQTTKGGNRSCLARNEVPRLPDHGDMYVSQNSSWCGKTEAGQRDVTNADRSHMITVEAPDPLRAPPGSTNCNPYEV